MNTFSHFLNSDTVKVDYQVTLSAFDKESDIAIFRLKSDVSPKPAKSLRWSDLTALPNTPTYPVPELVWTVGYVSDDVPVDNYARSKTINDTSTDFDAKFRDEIFHDDTINTSFDLYLRLYKQVIQQQKAAGDKDSHDVAMKLQGSPEARFRLAAIYANQR